jgi:acetylornithine deacetylase/succinyl-diaminopimelate desuccinylase-like protein
MKRLLVLLVLIGNVAMAASPRSVALRAREWREAHEREVVKELSSFLTLPNVASNSVDIQRNTEALTAMLKRRGLPVRILTIEGAPSLVVADLVVPRAKRTVSFYAHYDGQPVDPAKWRHSPWIPLLVDANGVAVTDGGGKLDPEWRLEGRSASDDKGAIVALLSAVDALQAAHLRPNVNIRFVFEGEEEAGSPHLAAYLATYSKELRSDAWILCDGPVHQTRKEQLLFGARGITDVELTVYGASRPLHSGHYGNWAPNPISMLVTLLAAMRDDEGRILIPHFYDDVLPLTEGERAALAVVPDVTLSLKRELALGRTESENLNEAILAPALNFRGIESGAVGAKAANSISSEASASIDFRLVPNQTPEKVKQRVEEFITARGYTIVRDTPDAATRAAHPRVIKMNWNAGGYPPARTDVTLPFSQQLIHIVEEAEGERPVVLPSFGASIPLYLFGDRSVIVPIANHDNNQHAANENIRLQNLWDGIEVFAALMAGLK